MTCARPCVGNECIMVKIDLIQFSLHLQELGLKQMITK